MWSFTSIQIIQDQQVKDALDRSRFSEEPKTNKSNRLQILRAVLARLTPVSACRFQAELKLSR
jgi:hypothetical protein